VLAVGCSLNFLSRGLGATGRWDAALGAANEAIAIFRANAGGPDLAEALTIGAWRALRPGTRPRRRRPPERPARSAPPRGNHDRPAPAGQAQ
jgi:hypothetical protein